MSPVLKLPEMAKSAKRKGIVRLISYIVVALLLCPVLIWAAKTYLPKLWGDVHFVNFAVAWIPAVLSIVVAFVPDKELETHLRIGWRIVVVVCGLLYSVMLWHQQTLVDASNGQAQQKLLSQAISEANKHADEQFGKVHGEVQDVSKDLDQTKKDLVGVVQSTSSALGVTIGNVTKPKLPDPAILTFTLWPSNTNADVPVMQSYLAPNADGNYSVDFTVANRSETTAKGLDIWVSICNGCSFASEPAGFEHPAGSDESTRHRKLGDLNPGVSFEKMSILVKAPPSSGFVVGFRYSCETCGGKGLENQIATLTHSYFGPPQPDKRAWKLQAPKLP